MQTYKPGSVSRLLEILIIYLGTQLLMCSIFLPFDNGRGPLNADILEISPHRVYLVSLQLNLYILSVALVLIRLLELTGVTRYATLWCPDFPLYSELDSEPYELN